MKLLDWVPLEKLDWRGLSQNSSPGAIELLEKNLDKVSWSNLSHNLSAIHLLEKNPDKIEWGMLTQNPNAIELLEKNPEKIWWSLLSRNTNAIHLLEKTIGLKKDINNSEHILLYGISFLLTIALSSFSYHFFEKKFFRLKDRYAQPYHNNEIIHKNV